MAETAFAEHARSAILDTGERVTPARVRVLGELLGADRALSHHDLEGALGVASIDRVTLYRVLDWLVERGLSCRTLGADRVFRFSATQSAAGHAHFECSVCGRVICLAAPTPQPAGLPHGFRAESVALTVRGRCADCNQT
jgi:Fur family ferric uptake transcriptional regulator